MQQDGKITPELVEQILTWVYEVDIIGARDRGSAEWKPPETNQVALLGLLIKVSFIMMLKQVASFLRHGFVFCVFL